MKRKSLPTGRDFLFVEGYGNENPGAFQSPRPLRGATCRGRRTTWRFCHFNPRAPCGARHGRLAHIPPAILYFNPRAPCGARHRKRQHRQADACISIHAPLAGRDRPLLTAITSPVDFNPRAPCGARHAQAPLQALHGHISIHAPLAGRDIEVQEQHAPNQHFNPRAPCGARQQECTNHYAHFCDNRQISDVFAQNADCQGILFLFCARKTCKF